MSAPVVAARLARRGREVKYPDREQIPPNNQIVEALVVCGRTDINCHARLGGWILGFMIDALPAGRLERAGLMPAGGQHRIGYSVVFLPGWKKIGKLWRVSINDQLRRPVPHVVPEGKTYRVNHEVGSVTSWRGHELAECPNPKCRTINAIGRAAFLKHEPALALADWGDFDEWAQRWLDKRYTAKQTNQ